MPHLSAYIPKALIYHVGRHLIFVHLEVPVCYQDSVNSVAKTA